MAEPTENESLADTPISPTRFQRLRRLGCAVILVLWFLILMVPCFFITLAFQGEISISQGSAPNQVFRIWLINEADHRGLGISTTQVQPVPEDGLCVQTDVRFLLWEGTADATAYCECYEVSDTQNGFTLTGANEGTCAP